MEHNHIFHHLQSRLRALYLGGLGMAIACLCFFTYTMTSLRQDVTTAQYILLSMGLCFLVGYFSVKKASADHAGVHLFLLFFLNIQTTALIAMTGSFQSPFILLYIIWIAFTAQLHAKKLALVQILLAILGYTITLSGIWPYQTMLPNIPKVASIFLPYALLYATVMIYAAFSLYPRVFRHLFAPKIPHDIHEAIVRNAPCGILVLDTNHTILSGNNKAKQLISWNNAECFHEHVDTHPEKLKSTLETITNEKTKANFMWKKNIPITISASAKKNADGTISEYILFLH